MGLSTLKAAPKSERPNLADIDLAPLGLEGTLSFRAPRVSDFFPKAEIRNKARVNFSMLADADPALETQFLLLCACYVPEADEQDDPVRVFGGLMRDNMEAFLVLVGLFGSTFPMSLGQAKEEAGNDLGQ